MVWKNAELFCIIYLCYVFFIILAIKWIIIIFQFKMKFITFILYYFFYPNLFFAFLFYKTFQSFFSIKVLCYICLRYSIFNFFCHKNFFRPIWSVTFRKNIFIFWYSHMVTNFKFRIFIILSTPKTIYNNTLHFNCCMICCLIINYII